MPRLLVRVFFSLALAGCAQAPILAVNVPAAEIEDCERLAASRDAAPSVAGRAAVQGAARGILGRAVEAAVAGTSLSLKILSYKAVGSFAAGSLAWPLALLGIAEGAAEGVMAEGKERERIVRECLRDLGHRVY